MPRLAACTLGLVGWLLSLALLGLHTAGPVALVGPADRMFRVALAAGARPLAQGPFGVIVAGSTADLPARLYAAGAWLVVPARAAGCGTVTARRRPLTSPPPGRPRSRAARTRPWPSRS